MKNTTLCYLLQGEQCLMLHRTKKQNDENAGKWIGVGGKFEEGESPEDCVCREVLEETGLTLTRFAYRGLVTFVLDGCTEFMHLFTADGFTGQLTACDEGELCWIPWKKLWELPHWKGDEIFLRLLEESAPFFSLKLVYEKEVLTAAALDGDPLPLPH